ncbi:MAG: RidA family protein [Saprospiraceae bacterium]|nr:RidA family protein [Saprospiraceae bacterium]
MIELQLKTLGIELPPPPPPGGIYHPVVITGNLLFVSGQPPQRLDSTLITGVVGKDLSIEEAKQAARQTGLTMLSTIKAHIGDLDKIKRLIKTLGMVNCKPGFTNQPQVINGFSELLVELLGDQNGKGARSAVGMILPGNIAVEIEAIFELH